MRIKLLAVILLAGIAGLAMDCSSTGPERERLSAPMWMCPEPPTNPVSGDIAGFGGIGARPGAGGIFLRWYIGSDEDLIGYQLFRHSEASQIFIRHATVLLSTDDLLNRRGQPFEYHDTQVSRNVTYDYFLYAIDSDTNRSVRSDTLSYTRVTTPTLGQPPDQARFSNTAPTFTYGYENPGGITQLGAAVVRVERRVGIRWELVWVSARSAIPYGLYPEDVSAVTYGTSGQVFMNELIPGQYRWRVDFIGQLATLPPAVPCYCVYDPDRCGADSDPSLPEPEDLSFQGSASAWRHFTVE
jgi:hypothetical protein